LTDIERLEEIKEQVEISNVHDDNHNGYWYRNIWWLIKRVEELEYENIELSEQNKRYRESLEYMLKRTREAMKKYGDRNSEEYNFERYNECSFYEDILEQALEGK